MPAPCTTSLPQPRGSREKESAQAEPPLLTPANAPAKDTPSANMRRIGDAGQKPPRPRFFGRLTKGQGTAVSPGWLAGCEHLSYVGHVRIHPQGMRGECRSRM